MSKRDDHMRIWDIVSIATAAPGWRVIYEDKRESDGYFEQPVACWALLRITSGRYRGWDESDSPIGIGKPCIERRVHPMTSEDGVLTPAEPDAPGSHGVSFNWWGLLAPNEGIDKLGPAPSTKRDPKKPAE